MYYIYNTYVYIIYIHIFNYIQPVIFLVKQAFRWTSATQFLRPSRACRTFWASFDSCNLSAKHIFRGVQGMKPTGFQDSTFVKQTNSYQRREQQQQQRHHFHWHGYASKIPLLFFSVFSNVQIPTDNNPSFQKCTLNVISENPKPLQKLYITTTNLSYRFSILETSATALCGTTGITSFKKCYPCDEAVFLLFPPFGTWYVLHKGALRPQPPWVIISPRVNTKYWNHHPDVWNCHEIIKILQNNDMIRIPYPKITHHWLVLRIQMNF